MSFSVVLSTINIQKYKREDYTIDIKKLTYAMQRGLTL